VRTVVFYFIILEILDALTTVVGLSKGLVELNPLFNIRELFLAKFLITIGISIALQKIPYRKLLWIVPLPVYTAVIWNLFNLVLVI
jgi:hypothetical protein